MARALQPRARSGTYLVSIAAATSGDERLDVSLVLPSAGAVVVRDPVTGRDQPGAAHDARRCGAAHRGDGRAAGTGALAGRLQPRRRGGVRAAGGRDRCADAVGRGDSRAAPGATGGRARAVAAIRDERPHPAVLPAAPSPTPASTSSPRTGSSSIGSRAPSGRSATSASTARTSASRGRRFRCCSPRRCCRRRWRSSSTPGTAIACRARATSTDGTRGSWPSSRRSVPSRCTAAPSGSIARPSRGCASRRCRRRCRRLSSPTTRRRTSPRCGRPAATRSGCPRASTTSS